ncbi:alpha/beta fold hydrolase [Leucobacter sp. CSA1]|uniref:Alpha/beta fold hydrolase n=1 Tax=Leucobacter chromiisoli TaxID=2796471 RepID=A0A934Q5B6_9MICO|nr:alpha/beta fold hydrolase [Leucobacter chromiisoli]
MHSVVVGGPDGDETDRRVVFLHGLFGRGKNFTRIASGLEPEAESLLVDLPNHGRSGWTEELGYAQLADIVADHLRRDFAQEGPVDVVGHSMGGKVAMVLALRHPDLVRRLVVIDIAPVASGAGRGEFQHLLDALAGVDLGALRRRSDADAALREEIPEDGVRGFLLQNLARDDSGFRWEPNLGLLRAGLETIMGFPDLSGSRFTGPVLWMGGDRSGYITDDDEQTMRSLFPRTVRMTVRGAGHWVHSEKPDAVIAALRTFLLVDREG